MHKQILVSTVTRPNKIWQRIAVIRNNHIYDALNLLLLINSNEEIEAAKGKLLIWYYNSWRNMFCPVAVEILPSVCLSVMRKYDGKTK